MNIKEEDLIRLYKNKGIFLIKNRPDVILKIIKIDNNFSQIYNEIQLQKKANELGLAPKIYEHSSDDNNVYIIMEQIKGQTIYDLYGYQSPPKNIWKAIRNIVQILLNNGIEYKDISPFNFIVDESEDIKIVDFGHARSIKVDWFVEQFLNGDNLWNPDFL